MDQNFKRTPPLLHNPLFPWTMQKEVPIHSWRQSTRPGKHEAHTANESHARDDDDDDDGDEDDDDDDAGGDDDDDDVERFESVCDVGVFSFNEVDREDAANDVDDA